MFNEKVTREKYLRNDGNPNEALLSAIGIWKDRTGLPEAETYVRELWRDRRLKRIWK